MRGNNSNYEHLCQDRSELQEKSITNRFNAVMTRGSGRGHDKGDVKIAGILRVECKNTIKKSFTITVDLIQKMKSMCKKDEVGFIQIDFVDKDSFTIDECVMTTTDVMFDYARLKALEIKDLN